MNPNRAGRIDNQAFAPLTREDSGAGAAGAVYALVTSSVPMFGGVIYYTKDGMYFAGDDEARAKFKASLEDKP